VPKVTPLRADDPDRIGRYRLDGRISGLPGAGPFYLAAGPDGTELAVRLLRGAWTHDAAARDRFAAEAGSARRVPPFCAARIMDFGASEDYAYLVSEYMPGRSLLEAVADSGRLRGLELDALAIGGATGLAAVHQAGLVHGSFGPEHVILGPDGPCIIEFGITPPYGQATPAADMLAWAQTMVFASMGRPPATLADLDVLPEVLREVVADCLAGDPGFRPEARAVVLALLGEGAPEAGTLAEGSRRAAQITEAAQRAAGEREAQQQARAAARAAPGGRTARHPGPDGRGPDRRGRDGRGPDGRGPAGPGADRDRTGGGSGAAGGRAGRRVPVVPITVALVLTAAVAFLLVHLAGGASPSHPPGAGGLGANSTSPVSSTDSAAPAPPPTVPAGLVGSWQGQVTLGIAGTTLDVQISLVAGSAGPDTIAYSSAGKLVCSGELTPQSTAASGALTLSQGIIKGQTKCGNGPVTLSSTGTGMSFTFRGKGAPPATGNLTRA
jgi:eukaryotic-like serine/threonine-protein kinase